MWAVTSIRLFLAHRVYAEKLFCASTLTNLYMGHVKFQKFDLELGRMPCCPPGTWKDGWCLRHCYKTNSHHLPYHLSGSKTFHLDFLPSPWPQGTGESYRIAQCLAAMWKWLLSKSSTSVMMPFIWLILLWCHAVEQGRWEVTPCLYYFSCLCKKWRDSIWACCYWPKLSACLTGSFQ